VEIKIKLGMENERSVEEFQAELTQRMLQYPPTRDSAYGIPR